MGNSRLGWRPDGNQASDGSKRVLIVCQEQGQFANGGSRIRFQHLETSDAKLLAILRRAPLQKLQTVFVALGHDPEADRVFSSGFNQT